MATEAGSYEGGAGGKFRKRPFRRSATPYDRPPTALRNPSEPGRNGWLSKLVDPASRIITKSAQMFFPSVFRKNLPALQTVSDTNQESRNELMETVPINTSGAEERVSNEGDNPSDNFNSNGFAELEQILKQKTFSRAEIDHLTELLRSRTVDVPVEHENKSSEPSTPQPVAAHDRQVELVDNPVLENGINRQRLVGVISTPEVLEEDVDSPARLAKDYMGSRPLKASPSILGFRSQAFRDTAALQSNLSFPPMSPSMSLAPRSAIRFAGVTGVPEVGGLTPRPRGRSAIYSMARTPFSKVHLSAANKGVGSTIDRYAGPSTSSQLTWENNSLSSGQQISKRRSSVLDSDIGSVGTIRRIRQKTNLISPLKHIRSVHGSPLSLPGIGVGSDAAQRSRSSFQKPLLLDQPKYNSSNMLVENEDNSIPSTSFAAVPTQSSEMARKILQQLDKLVPSPKEKSSELKLATAKERSPTKLTVSMSYRQAFRSVEDVESSKFLHNAQVDGNLDGLGGTHVPGSRDSTSQKQDKVEENGPSKIAVPRDRLAHVVNGVDTTISINDLAPGVNAADLSISYFNANPPQKKRAFQMSAQEDALEQDDGGYSTGVASTATATGRENTSVAESKTIAAESVTVDKPPSSFSEIKSPANFVWNKGTSTGASDGTVVAQKNMAFTFTVAPSPSSSTQPATFAPESTSVFDEAVPPKEPTTASVFSFSSKSVDKAPPITFSSTYSGLGEFSGLKSGVLSDSKLETSSSFATVAATATNTISKTAEADKSDNDYSRKPGDLFPKPATAISSGVSISTSPSSFSFGASTNNSSLNNGLLAANPSIFSILAPSVPVSGSSTNQFFSSGSTFIATNATPSSSPSTSATAPTFPSAPMFQFGSNTSSSSLSNAVSPASATSGIEARDFEPKTKQASTFGSQTRSPFSITSASNGSSIFGNTASATTSIMKFSTANNQPQSSTPFVTGTGSLFGAQAAPGGTGVASFTQSMPSQFGSSASSPTYGLSGASAFTSGSSVFGSSTPATKVFDSSSGFGLSSSAAFSTGANSSSGSSTISSVFGSSLQPATSSIFGSSFGSSPSPTTGFSFGGSSTAVTGTGSAPITFGSSIAPPTDSMFSFTSAITTSSSASFSPLQHVFGNPNSVVTYGSASPGNDQMNMEDSMAEDTAQASTPAVSAFGQPAASPPPSNLVFGSPSPSGALPFQFGSQQNLSTPQNPSSFQAAGSLELNAEGSFSLGTGGTDKSNRKFVKVRRDKVRKR